MVAEEATVYLSYLYFITMPPMKKYYLPQLR